jgi:hypothetical protein
LLGFHFHTWAEAARKTPKDPLNFFFAGALADLDQAADAVMTVLGWRHGPLPDGTQWFVESGASGHDESWHRHDRSLASSPFTFPGIDRYHVRMYAGHIDHPEFGPLLAMSMHHEHFDICRQWDVADSFIEPARTAARAFEAKGYLVREDKCPAPFAPVQCDGLPTYWDGTYFVVMEGR